MIPYASIYGHTEAVVRQLADRLAAKGVTDIRLYDVAKIHPSYLVAEAFRCSHLVLASVTYNNGLFPPMETFLLDLKAHAFQNRWVALIQNGSWAPVSGKLMTALLSEMKNITIDDTPLTLTSALLPHQDQDLDYLADRIFQAITHSN